MLKKIAYIELDTHAEIALNFMELIKDSKEFSVDYFFSEKVLRSFGFAQDDMLPENIKKATPENVLSKLAVTLSPSKSLQSKYDLIVIGTAHRYFNVFEKIAEKYNTAVICHNLNFVKTSKWDLLKALFKEDFKYRLKLLLKEGLWRKSEVYKKARHLLVLDKGFDSAQPDKYRFLPVFYSKFSTQPTNEVLTIVIPGAVSQKRRDYERVLKMLRQSFDSAQDDKHDEMKVVFLGKAQGKELEMLQDFLDPSTQLRMTNMKIKYFTEKVSQSEFDEYMQKADVLWCPIQQKTEFFSQKEIYGITKMSGNIGDAIKFSKAAIFPETYPSVYDFIIPEKGSFQEFISHKKTSDFSDFSKDKILAKLEKSLKQMTS